MPTSTGSNATSPVLYSFRRCPYAMRARLALYYSGQRVELREVVLRDKPQALLDLSPKATVPVLHLPSGAVIEESLDIMHWALGQGDPEDWRLGGAAEANAIMRSLVAENDGPFKGHLDRYKYAYRYEGVSPLDERAGAEVFIRRLEACLEAGPYLMGAHFSWVDAAIFPFIRQFANTDRSYFDAAPFTGVQGWLARALAMPLFEQVMQKYGQWAAGDRPVYLGR